jgi:hypothetical protein
MPFLLIGRTSDSEASSDGKDIRENDSPGDVMMERERRAKHYLMDMDGVIYRGNKMIPGADRFVKRLKTVGRKFLFLTMMVS